MKRTIISLLVIVACWTSGCERQTAVSQVAVKPEKPKASKVSLRSALVAHIISVHPRNIRRVYPHEGAGQRLDFMHPLKITLDFVIGGSNGGARSGGYAVTIPTGTVLLSGSKGTQDLITAQRVVAILPPSPAQDESSPSPITDLPRASVEIEVYCLDRFLAFPQPGSPYHVAQSDGEVFSERSEVVMDEVERLDAYLAKRRDIPYHIRQMAVWMISEKFLQLTRQQAIDRFRERLGSHLGHEIREVLESRGEDTLKSALPSNTNPALIHKILERYKRKGPDYVIAMEARRELQEYWGHVKPLLAACGFDVQHARFNRR